MLLREPPAKQLESLTMPAMCPPRRTPFEILRKHGALNSSSWGSSCKLDVFLVPVDSILVRRRFPLVTRKAAFISHLRRRRLIASGPELPEHAP